MSKRLPSPVHQLIATDNGTARRPWVTGRPERETSVL